MLCQGKNENRDGVPPIFKQWRPVARRKVCSAKNTSMRWRLRCMAMLCLQQVRFKPSDQVGRHNQLNFRPDDCSGCTERDAAIPDLDQYLTVQFVLRHRLQLLDCRCF